MREVSKVEQKVRENTDIRADIKNSYLRRPPGPKLEPHQVLFCHIIFHVGESKGKVCFAMESIVHKRKEFRTCNFPTVFFTRDRLDN